MTDRPRVDVGVVTWNTAELTARNLRRLIDTQQDCDLRVLVRDNASTDGTVARLRSQVPEADIDAGAENLGFAAGVNTLLRRSDAPWFFLLNSDARPEPGAIHALADAGAIYPRAAAIAPRLEDDEGNLEHSTHPFPSVRVAATCAFAWSRISRERGDELFLEGFWSHDRRRIVDWAIGAALLMRREAVDNVGGFDERFFMYAEDLEWCWRAHERGWQILFEPAARVRHEGNASGKQMFGSLRTREHVRNACRFYRGAHGMANTAVWWGLNVAGGLIHGSGAFLRRDKDAVRRSADHVVAHVAALKPRSQSSRAN